MIDNMFLIYRLPPSRQNGFKNSTSLTEWPAGLDELTFITHDIVIKGDLNFHLDNKSNSAKLFNSILESHGLRQHVTGK